MYLVIFCYWVGPVPYLELFGVGPVEKNTLYYSLLGPSNVWSESSLSRTKNSEFESSSKYSQGPADKGDVQKLLEM